VKNLTRNISLFASLLLLVVGNQSIAQTTASSINELLDLVEQDRVNESEDYRERIREFEQNVSQQEQILQTTIERVAAEEATGAQLSDVFEANEIIIRDKTEILRDRRGDLNELFGTVQGVAGDVMSTFDNSLISAQYPGRTDYLEEFIDKAGSTTAQLNVDELERFWFFMMQEITESAKVVTYNGEVALPDGNTQNRSITRIGTYNAVSDGEYLSYDGDIGHLQVLPRQPDGDIMASARDLASASSGFTKTGIDPTGGVGDLIRNYRGGESLE